MQMDKECDECGKTVGVSDVCAHPKFVGLPGKNDGEENAGEPGGELGTGGELGQWSWYRVGGEFGEVPDRRHLEHSAAEVPRNILDLQ